MSGDCSVSRRGMTPWGAPADSRTDNERCGARVCHGPVCSDRSAWWASERACSKRGECNRRARKRRDGRHDHGHDAGSGKSRPTNRPSPSKTPSRARNAGPAHPRSRGSPDLDQDRRRLDGVGRLQNVVDRCRVLAPEIIGTHRRGRLEVHDAGLRNARTEGHEFLPGAEPVPRKAHDVARRVWLSSAFVAVRSFGFHLFADLFRQPRRSRPPAALVYIVNWFQFVSIRQIWLLSAEISKIRS